MTLKRSSLCKKGCEDCLYAEICEGCFEDCLYGERENLGNNVSSLMDVFDFDNVEEIPPERIEKKIKMVREILEKHPLKRLEYLPEYLPEVDPDKYETHFYRYGIPWPEGCAVNFYDILKIRKLRRFFPLHGLRSYMEFETCGFDGQLLVFDILPDELANYFSSETIAILFTIVESYHEDRMVDALAIHDIPDYADFPKNWTWSKILKNLESITDLFYRVWNVPTRSSENWDISTQLNAEYEIEDLYKFPRWITFLGIASGTHKDQFVYNVQKLVEIGMDTIVINCENVARLGLYKKIIEFVELARKNGAERVIAYGLNPGIAPKEAFVADSYVTRDWYKDAAKGITYTKGKKTEFTLKCDCEACSRYREGHSRRIPGHNLLESMARLERYGKEGRG